jgi:hypothetical protein
MNVMGKALYDNKNAPCFDSLLDTAMVNILTRLKTGLCTKGSGSEDSGMAKVHSFPITPRNVLVFT